MEFSKMSINASISQGVSTSPSIPQTESTTIFENSTDNETYFYTYNYEHEHEPDFNSFEKYTFAIEVSEFLSHYYTPTIVVFGSIGNILSVIVFFKTKLRKLSSSYYLAALGISDTVFLLVAFATWLNFLNINLYNKKFYCELFTYLSGLCSFLSVWFVVAFTVERYIAVLYPLQRQFMCTVRRACSVLIGLFFVGCLVNIPCFIYASPVYSEGYKDYICDIEEKYKYHMQIFNYIDTVIVFIIPFTIICVLNTITAFAVWKVAGVRRKMTMTTKKLSTRNFRRRCHSQNCNNSDYTCVAALNSSRQSMRGVPKRNANSSQVKVTKMLLIVSSVFVMLNLPSYIMRIKAFLIENDEKTFQTTVTTILTQTISWFLFITNFGINFVLYCLSGQNFRKAVMSMFKRFRKEKIRHHEVVTTQVTVAEYFRSANSSTKRRVVTSPSTYAMGNGGIQEFNSTCNETVLHNNSSFEPCE